MGRICGLANRSRRSETYKGDSMIEGGKRKRRKRRGGWKRKGRSRATVRTEAKDELTGLTSINEETLAFLVEWKLDGHMDETDHGWHQATP